jgi:hypothetical protein
VVCPAKFGQLAFHFSFLLLGILYLLLFSRCDKKSGDKKQRWWGRMSLQKQFQCFALLALCLGCAQLLFAQGTDLGTIRGLVTDSSGAVIPNAKVTSLDLGTNTTRETATNARGEYQMFGLRRADPHQISAARIKQKNRTAKFVTIIRISLPDIYLSYSDVRNAQRGCLDCGPLSTTCSSMVR